MRADPVPVSSGLADLSPACFAMVMATGIVSIAARQQGWRTAGLVLFGLNIAAWLAFWVLTVLRLARHLQRFLGDLRDHLRGPGFFTAVAGTALLGSQLASFTAFTIKEDKPPLDRGINGAWLLAVVALLAWAAAFTVLLRRGW